MIGVKERKKSKINKQRNERINDFHDFKLIIDRKFSLLYGPYYQYFETHKNKL